MASDLSKLLRNKTVLYVILFFAVTNVIGFMLLGNSQAALLFIAVGFLVTFFSKNMTVVLLTALIVTNLYVGTANHAGRVSEGFGSGARPKSNKKKKKSHKENFNPKGPHPIEVDADSDTDSDDQDAPPRRASAALDHSEATGKAPKLDFEGTLNAAYENLGKTVGPGGLASMSSDTAKIAANQDKLMEHMDKLEPLIQRAGSMLEGLEGGSSKLEAMMGKVGGMMGGVEQLSNKLQ